MAFVNRPSLGAAVHEVIRDLKGSFAGRIVRPGDGDFERASGIWNGMVARTPAVILLCSSVPDVQTAVRSAVAAGALTAVRCGGHSLAGFSTCDGGVVIDLSPMRQVVVNESDRRARAGGGCLLGTIDAATQRVGLACPAGVVSHTGAAGLFLGGGTGWLTRMFGLSCDNIEGFTMITVDGSLVHANAVENPDLFWALRGGGGNFGVVSEFELRLHPIRSALVGEAFLTANDIPRALRLWREFMPDAPDQLQWNVSLMLAPESDLIPTSIHSRPVLSQSVVWLGDPDPARRYLDHALTAGSPVGVTRKLMSFIELQSMADHKYPHGARYYTKSGYFPSLHDSAIDLMLEALNTSPSTNNQIEIAYLGGAAARVDATETAFGDRSAPYIINLLAHWTCPDDDQANVAWIRSLFASLRPYMKPGVYVNFMSGDEDDRVREAYSQRWERLLAIKTHYDPHNFFRLNQNIRVRAHH